MDDLSSKFLSGTSQNPFFVFVAHSNDNGFFLFDHAIINRVDKLSMVPLVSTVIGAGRIFSGTYELINRTVRIFTNFHDQNAKSYNTKKIMPVCFNILKGFVDIVPFTGNCCSIVTSGKLYDHWRWKIIQPDMDNDNHQNGQALLAHGMNHKITRNATTLWLVTYDTFTKHVISTEYFKLIENQYKIRHNIDQATALTTRDLATLVETTIKWPSFILMCFKKKNFIFPKYIKQIILLSADPLLNRNIKF